MPAIAMLGNTRKVDWKSQMKLMWIFIPSRERGHICLGSSENHQLKSLERRYATVPRKKLVTIASHEIWSTGSTCDNGIGPRWNVENFGVFSWILFRGWIGSEVALLLELYMYITVYYIYFCVLAVNICIFAIAAFLYVCRYINI